jgi:hypothetical protein
MALQTQNTVIVTNTDWVQLATGTVWFVVVLEGSLGVILSDTKPASSLNATEKGFKLDADGRRDYFSSSVASTIWGRSINERAKVSPSVGV